MAKTEVTDATIKIRPSSTANYIPSEWTFQMDADVIMQRLINDLYEQPADFLRELIQNALDAARCQMYLELQQDGIGPPEFPTQVDEDRRKRYQIELRLEEIEAVNELSGEPEKRQVLTVEDHGIGMDRDIIQRYFLQVGRSYYTSEEFKRSFTFFPTSRFGLGFLSVFAVSDRVEVETFRPDSPSREGPIRLTLTGPRNYLLTEKGSLRKNGTRIRVVLRQPMEPGQITQLVTSWCKRVEFPIYVNDLGRQTVVVAEQPEQFTHELPLVTDPDARFQVKAYPIERHGIEGEIYVFARVDSTGESWDSLH